MNGRSQNTRPVSKKAPRGSNWRPLGEAPAPLPEWLAKAWAGDSSLLPKRPPAKAGEA